MYCGKLQKNANCGYGVGNCVMNLIFTYLSLYAGGGVADRDLAGRGDQGRARGIDFLEQAGRGLERAGEPERVGTLLERLCAAKGDAIGRR